MPTQTRHIFFVFAILLSRISLHSTSFNYTNYLQIFLIFFIAIVTGTTIVLDNSPISTNSPALYFPAKDNPWIQPKDNYIYNSTIPFVPSNVWWMNLIMQGGTGFYSLTVVETPE